MAVFLSPVGGAAAQFFTDSGVPLTGGKLYSYAAGTTTPQVTYTTSAGNIAHTNPIILNSAGRVPTGEIWLTQGLQYKFVIKDSDEVLIGTYDNVANNEVAIFNQLANTSDISLGDALIGFKQAKASGFLTGAIARTVHQKFTETVSVRDVGAVGDGSTNDTAAIQNAVFNCSNERSNKIKLYWPAGTYLITNTITLASNTYIEFDQGVVINFVPAAVETTSLFVAANQTDITIIGNFCRINGTRTGAVLEGNANAFFLYGSDNIYLQNIIVSNFATDGYTITGDATGSDACNNIIIEGCQAINCRRNGMSIISARNLQVIGGKYAESNGAPNGPWAGIDIEPNFNCFIEGITIVGVLTNSNQGNGIQCTPGAFVGLEKRFDVNIIGHRSLSDGSVDSKSLSGFACRNGIGFNTPGKVYGKIVYSDFTIESPKSAGISMDSWPADQMPLLIVENGTIFNPNSTGTGTDPYSACGVLIFRSVFDTGIGNYGNLKMRNLHIEDLRGTPKMYSPVYVEGAVAGTTFKDMFFEDIDGINYTNTTYGVVGFAVNANSTFQNCTARFNNSPALKATNTALWRFPGQEQQFTSSGRTATLAAANYTVGTDYIVSCGAGINSISIVPNAGDTITWPVGVASSNLILDEGGYLHLRSVGGGVWNIIELRGNYRNQVSTNFQRRMIWTAAAPTTGTWTQGDVAFNVSATVGQPKAWQCTVSGTPGTWVSTGNL